MDKFDVMEVNEIQAEYIRVLRSRIKKLENAIKKHRDSFDSVDDGAVEDIQLWMMVEDVDESSDS